MHYGPCPTVRDWIAVYPASIWVPNRTCLSLYSDLNLQQVYQYADMNMKTEVMKTEVLKTSEVWR